MLELGMRAVSSVIYDVFQWKSVASSFYPKIEKVPTSAVAFFSTHRVAPKFCQQSSRCPRTRAGSTMAKRNCKLVAGLSNQLASIGRGAALKALWHASPPRGSRYHQTLKLLSWIARLDHRQYHNFCLLYSAHITADRADSVAQGHMLKSIWLARKVGENAPRRRNELGNGGTVNVFLKPQVN